MIVLCNVKVLATNEHADMHSRGNTMNCLAQIFLQLTTIDQNENFYSSTHKQMTKLYWIHDSRSPRVVISNIDNRQPYIQKERMLLCLQNNGNGRMYFHVK